MLRPVMMWLMDIRFSILQKEAKTPRDFRDAFVLRKPEPVRNSGHSCHTAGGRLD